MEQHLWNHKVHTKLAERCYELFLETAASSSFKMIVHSWMPFQLLHSHKFSCFLEQEHNKYFKDDKDNVSTKCIILPHNSGLDLLPIPDSTGTPKHTYAESTEAGYERGKKDVKAQERDEDQMRCWR